MLSLIFVNGPDKGRVVHLDGSEPVLIGRTAPVLRLKDSRVSRRHAQLRQQDGHWLIEDLGSTNGTWVNDERIARVTALREGDRIQCGRLLMVVGQVAEGTEGAEAGPDAGRTGGTAGGVAGAAALSRGTDEAGRSAQREAEPALEAEPAVEAGAAVADRAADEGEPERGAGDLGDDFDEDAAAAVLFGDDDAAAADLAPPDERTRGGASDEARSDGPRATPDLAPEPADEADDAAEAPSTAGVSTPASASAPAPHDDADQDDEDDELARAIAAAAAMDLDDDEDEPEEDADEHTDADPASAEAGRAVADDAVDDTSDAVSNAEPGALPQLAEADADGDSDASPSDHATEADRDSAARALVAPLMPKGDEDDANGPDVADDADAAAVADAPPALDAADELAELAEAAEPAPSPTVDDAAAPDEVDLAPPAEAAEADAPLELNSAVDLEDEGEGEADGDADRANLEVEPSPSASSDRSDEAGDEHTTATATAAAAGVGEAPASPDPSDDDFDHLLDDLDALMDSAGPSERSEPSASTPASSEEDAQTDAEPGDRAGAPTEAAGPGEADASPPARGAGAAAVVDEAEDEAEGDTSAAPTDGADEPTIAADEQAGGTGAADDDEPRGEPRAQRGAPGGEPGRDAGGKPGGPAGSAAASAEGGLSPRDLHDIVGQELGRVEYPSTIRIAPARWGRRCVGLLAVLLVLLGAGSAVVWVLGPDLASLRASLPTSVAVWLPGDPASTPPAPEPAPPRDDARAAPRFPPTATAHRALPAPGEGPPTYAFGTAPTLIGEAAFPKPPDTAAGSPADREQDLLLEALAPDRAPAPVITTPESAGPDVVATDRPAPPATRDDHADTDEHTDPAEQPDPTATPSEAPEATAAEPARVREPAAEAPAPVTADLDRTSPGSMASAPPPAASRDAAAQPMASRDTADQPTASPDTGAAPAASTDVAPRPTDAAPKRAAARNAAPADDTPRLAFLIDASGSQIDTLPLVIDWVSQRIDNLDERTRFTVLFFRDGEVIEAPPAGLKPAHRAMKRDVLAWLDPAAGHVVPAGRSDAVAALRRAARYGVRDVFLLTDGHLALRVADAPGPRQHDAPPAGDPSEPTQTLIAAVQSIFGDGPPRIHGVQFFYEDPPSALEALARHFGGTYRFIGAETLTAPDEEPRPGLSSIP